MKKTSIIPIPVNKALKTLGENIKEARIKRRLTLELVAERAAEKGIKVVVFDRGGYLYHGRVQALAEAARENGLEF